MHPNLDDLLKTFGGDQIEAYRAIESEAIKYADANKLIESCNEASITINGIGLNARCTIADGAVRVPAAFVPKE